MAEIYVSLGWFYLLSSTSGKSPVLHSCPIFFDLSNQLVDLRWQVLHFVNVALMGSSFLFPYDELNLPLRSL